MVAALRGVRARHAGACTDRSRSASPPATRCCMGRRRRADAGRSAGDSTRAADVRLRHRGRRICSATTCGRASTRRRRQPALHHGQGQGAQRALPRACTRPAPASTRCRCRSRSVLRTREARRPRRRRRGLRRPDHLELLHEARVRQEAHRGLLRVTRSNSPTSSTPLAPTFPATARRPSILVGRNRNSDRYSATDSCRPRRPWRAAASRSRRRVWCGRAIVDQVDRARLGITSGSASSDLDRDQTCDAPVEPQWRRCS